MNVALSPVPERRAQIGLEHLFCRRTILEKSAASNDSECASSNFHTLQKAVQGSTRLKKA
jgi:hypothetical protein